MALRVLSENFNVHKSEQIQSNSDQGMKLDWLSRHEDLGHSKKKNETKDETK